MNTPAFPSETKNESGEYNKGITERDYFAAKALQGFIANGVDHYDGQGDTERYAKLSYKYADAMLKEKYEQ